MKLDLNLQVVKDFAHDVWDDLARTRLAGVAIGLVLALVAITAIVLRPGGDPDAVADGPLPAIAATDDDDVSFTVPGEEPLRMSDLNLSAPRDPFRSLGGGTDAANEQTLLAASEEMLDSVMGGGSSGAPSTGGDNSSSLMPLDDLSGGSAPTTTPVTDPEPTDGDFDEPEDTHEPASTPVTDYSYTADVQFGLVDDLKRYATVQRLGLIPSKSEPLIMYLGTTSDHKTAVFMVDSRLSQGGEGRCVPKDSLCTFLELRATPAQDEHHFRDADGNEYLLRLRGLTRSTASNGSLSGRSVSALPGSPPVVDGTR